MREIVTLVCTGCATPGKAVYPTMKNKKNDPDRLDLTKYCRWCRSHAVHKEKR